MAYLYTLNLYMHEGAKRKIRIVKQEGEIIPSPNSFSQSAGFRIAKPTKWGAHEIAVVDMQEGKPFMWKVWLEKDNYKKARKLLINYQDKALKREKEKKERELYRINKMISILEEVQNNE